jgi:beta-mannosidase
VRQVHESDQVVLSVSSAIERWGNAECSVFVRVTAPDGSSAEAWDDPDGDSSLVQVAIQNPQLWWPNGYGEQPLYQVEVSLRSSGIVVDGRSFNIGLRTLELRQEEDEWGRSFTFFVNGVPIFAKGSNWIPTDSFPTRISDQHLEKLLGEAAATHQNMLRVWGGGFYEESRFYDICDRLGILVWQDGIFSCSIYPFDEPEFMDNVRQEVVENVRRLRHHASLALWCGNNEMEQGWESWGWSEIEISPDLRPQLESMARANPMIRFLLNHLDHMEALPGWEGLRAAYEQFFHHTLPGWIAELDPDTDYWPSSPSSNTPFHDVNGQAQGDAHYWEVWHGRMPFTAYRNQFPRFMSEFGFQSLPPLETVRSYAEEEDWNMTSYIMEHHQRSWSGNGLMLSQMTDTFRMPKDFPSLVYLSMLLQAEGIRYGVEHWRRNRERVSGTLYWQLNDCWPVASWSSLDYFGRWKALHYAAKRFYAPLLLSVEDKLASANIGTLLTDAIAQHQAVMDVHLTSDLLQPWQGELAWTLETIGGEAITHGEQTVEALPLQDRLVCSLDLSEYVSDATRRALIFVCELYQQDDLVARSVVSLVPPKHLELVNPLLDYALQENDGKLVIEVSAQSLARFVELSFTGADVVFSDNYFDLPAGRVHRVTCPLPAGWDLLTASEALCIQSLYDSFM